MPVDTNTAALALKVPTEVKEAVASLCATYFKEARFPGGELAAMVGFGKINDVANMLLVRGLRSTLIPIETFTQQIAATVDHFAAIVAFFEANPSVRSVQPSDFPNDGELRDWLTQVIDEEVVHPEGGAERRWVHSRYANHQDHLDSLCRAIQAIRCALGEAPASVETVIEHQTLEHSAATMSR